MRDQERAGGGKASTPKLAVGVLGILYGQSELVLDGARGLVDDDGLGRISVLNEDYAVRADRFKKMKPCGPKISGPHIQKPNSFDSAKGFTLWGDKQL